MCFLIEYAPVFWLAMENVVMIYTLVDYMFLSMVNTDLKSVVVFPKDHINT